jgi:hypothetical protein
LSTGLKKKPDYVRRKDISGLKKGKIIGFGNVYYDVPGNISFSCFNNRWCMTQGSNRKSAAEFSFFSG